MPNQENEKEKRPLKFKEKLDIACKIIGTFSVLISAIALVTTLYPQLILGNNSLIAKANAGHIKSQILLAEHYFEIGEYEDSIYWYKLAGTKSGKYQALACNNLGLIYANGYGLSDRESDRFCRYEKALRLYAEAYEIASKSTNDYVAAISETNGIDLLRYFSEDCFPNSNNYSDTMLSWRDIAISRKVVVFQSYKSFDTYYGATFWDENTYYTYSGAYVGQNNNGYFTQPYYKYYGHTYSPNTEPYEPKFIYLSDIT